MQQFSLVERPVIKSVKASLYSQEQVYDDVEGEGVVLNPVTLISF